MQRRILNIKTLITILNVVGIFAIACNTSQSRLEPKSKTLNDNLDNQTLIQLRKADQEDRILGCTPEVFRRDSLRQIRLRELLDSNLVKTAKDHYNAGLLFHHWGRYICQLNGNKNVRESL